MFLRWLIVFFLLPLIAAADPVEVDVELILMVDVSRSMSPEELELQRKGYAEALSSDEVASAISSGLIGTIALTYVEWAGRHSQRVVVDWTAVSSQTEAQAFADKLTAHFEPSLRRTSISGALLWAADSLERNGFDGLREVIDVSGDGPNNHGRPVLRAREAVLAKGVTINGLPLMTDEPDGQPWHIDDLDEYYRACVIGGPGAFVIPVTDWTEFALAVRQKLVLEIAGPVPLAAQGPGYDCLIGEKIWQRYFQDGFP